MTFYKNFKTTYCCQTCNKEFNTREELETHEKNCSVVKDNIVDVLEIKTIVNGIENINNIRLSYHMFNHIVGDVLVKSFYEEENNDEILSRLEDLYEYYPIREILYGIFNNSTAKFNIITEIEEVGRFDSIDSIEITNNVIKSRKAIIRLNEIYESELKDKFIMDIR